MIHKKLLGMAAFVVAASLSLAACGGSGAPSSAPSAPASTAATSAPATSAPTDSGSKTFRVAYVARAQTDTFASWLANEIKAAAAKYPDIKLEVFDGNADDNTENSMIENAITNKFDGIIIQPNNGDAQKPYVQKAVDAGLKTITTNPKIDGVTGSSTIDQNPYDGATGLAKVAVDKIPQGAKVVVLNGPAGNFHATERRKAWQDSFFSKRSDVKIVGEDIANWNKDEAMTKMETWSVANPDIAAVISMNDNMALGALEAVKGNDKFKSMQAYGYDATPEGVQAVVAGTLTGTVLQSAGDLAQLNLKAMHDLLTGAKTQVSDNVPAPLVDSTNAAQYVDMYKKAGLIQ